MLVWLHEPEFEAVPAKLRKVDECGLGCKGRLYVDERELYERKDICRHSPDDFMPVLLDRS